LQKEMKKAILLTIDFPPANGGMARHSADVASAVKETGYEMVVIAPSADRDAEYDAHLTFCVHRMRSLAHAHIFDHYLKSVMLFFAHGLRFSFWPRADIIIANTWSIAGIAAFLIRKVTGAPYIVFAHGLDVYAPRTSPKILRLMKLVLKNASVVVANSDYTRSLVLAAESGAKTVVLNPCVDTGRFMAEPVLVPGLQGTGRKILTVARLVRSKGHDIVLQALAGVVRRFPDLEYFIVGDGPQRERLKGIARELGLTKNVIFTGEVDDAAVISYYRACDIFILTSKELKASGEVEGFGIAFLEAGACAKAVIGSRCGGIPDAVIDGVTGLFVEESDINGTSEAIIKLLSDDNLRRGLGENGKARVDRGLNAGAFAMNLKRILNEAAS
jgi:phosphatidylinositol alpha-1,6-mannosyltransferase